MPTESGTFLSLSLLELWLVSFSTCMDMFEFSKKGNAMGKFNAKFDNVSASDSAENCSPYPSDDSSNCRPCNPCAPERLGSKRGCMPCIPDRPDDYRAGCVPCPPCPPGKLDLCFPCSPVHGNYDYECQSCYPCNPCAPDCDYGLLDYFDPNCYPCNPCTPDSEETSCSPSNRSCDGCFITSACVEGRGLTDDCDALQTLRVLRDKHRLYDPGFAALVEEYYKVAPAIVKAINDRQDTTAQYEELFRTMVKPCVDMIKDNRENEAIKLYTQVVLRLKQQYVSDVQQIKSHDQ